MWTAKLIKKNYIKGDDKIEVIVEYTDGVDTINQTYKITNPSREILKEIIKEKIENLNNLENLDNTLVKGEIDLTETPIIPIALSDEEKTFIENLKLFEKLKKMADYGLIQSDDSKFVNIKTQVIATLNNNPEWIKYI